MVDKTKEWWQGQNHLLLGLLGLLSALLGIFLLGLWTNLSEIKNSQAKSAEQIVEMKNCLPRDYVSQGQYKSDQQRDYEYRNSITNTLSRIENKIDAHMIDGLKTNGR